MNRAHEECISFNVNSSMLISIDYEIHDRQFDEYPIVSLTFHKGGQIRSHRFWTDKIHLSYVKGKTGNIMVAAQPVILACGMYSVTTAIFHKDFPVEQRYFTISNKMYDTHPHAYQIAINKNGRTPLNNDVVFLHPSEWYLNGTNISSHGHEI